MASPNDPIVELPGDYYLVHFQTLLDTVVDRYDDLLSAEERSFAAAFGRLPEAARRLFVRLSSRKGPVFRSDRLAYAEIPDLRGAWETLVANGFLAIDDPAFLGDALALLTVPELRDLVRETNIDSGSGTRSSADSGNGASTGKGAGMGTGVGATTATSAGTGAGARAGRSKDGLVQLVLSALPREALQTALNSRFRWLFPNHQEILRVFRLLFFGTPEPDLTTFVLSDLGKVRFESYPLLSTHRLFTRREEIDRALLLRDLLDGLYQVLEEGIPESLPEGLDAEAELERLTSLLPPSDGHPLLTRWRRRFLEQAGRFWERRGNPRRALALYEDPATLPARERCARLLLRGERRDEARACCEAILAAPRDPEEEEVAESLLARIQDRGRRRPAAAPLVEILRLPFPTAEAIECRVLQACTDGGRPGFIAENLFWTGLFALVFWDILYLPVPRAFGHPFQAGPVDLFSAEFRPAREEPIRKRLEDLVSERGWRGRVLETHRAKAGIANALIAWEALPFPIVEKVLDVIPGHHLAAVFERLSRNPRGFRTGFSDLFLFVPEAPGYLLAEVKSPNDRLQNNQKSWMRFFTRHGIPCRLIQVEYERQA